MITVKRVDGSRPSVEALDVLAAAGPRGASHEDFVEAGLARDYGASLRELVDEHGAQIRTDFTTGQARWVLAGDVGSLAI